MANVDLGRYKKIVQYFWDPEPTNDDASKQPVWCLGKQYPIISEDDEPCASSQVSHRPEGFQTIDGLQVASEPTPPDSTSSSYDTVGKGEKDNGGWPTQFLDDFESRIWLTYRSNFPAIPKSLDPKATASMTIRVRLSQLTEKGFTSDTGWGCMIRSGQSLLANALSVVELGRDWRRGAQPQKERELLSLFADDPRAPYSIHKFVEHGAAACGKFPGEWFGPSATARCIQALTNSQPDANMRVYITGDGGDVYEDSFMAIAKPAGECFRPTLILVGTRLGIDQVTPVYWEALKSTLQMPQSIGIAGGRPSASLYFVGVQGSYFFYLDPHFTREALPLVDEVEKLSQADIDSCHTKRLRRLHIKEMDPSMLIAFLITSEEEWKSWRDSVRYVQGKAVIHVADKDPELHRLDNERDSAIDEVESVDDDDETVLVE